MDVAALTTAEQARLTSGRDFWTTKPEGGLASIMMTDGPHGLRKQEGAADALGIGASVPATCFPPAVGLAQTWDPDLARRIGAAIAAEAIAAEVSVVLGPGINLKRSPLGGRNFEYFSEDPILTAQLAAAWIDGLQKLGVGSSLKHFAANNQETDRMRVSADIDERTLHELYLRAFRRVVKDSQPWTVMCSYNRINGVHTSEDRELLTSILRDDWGFDGVVISDWGAVVDRTRSVAAGLDLMMPFGGDGVDAAVADAVESGDLDPDALRISAERVALLVARATEPGPSPITVDAQAHHDLAREAASAAIVLLRNDADLLPLDTTSRLAVIGQLAATPRYQGGGSSHVNATRVDIPLNEISSRADSVTFSAGYTIPGSDAAPAGDLHAQAVAAAADADTAVLFLGLADGQESEGFDRADMELPADQLALAEAVVAANPRTVIVLSHGGAVRVAPLTAPALLDAALLGQAGGSALADVLFGVVNPSGRLAETLPLRIEDTPAYLSFPGEQRHVRYGEGLFIGYRWFDARDMEVSYPFGHGLSYTTFDYRDLSVRVTDEGLAVEVTVANTGDRDGREVVQVYVGHDDSSMVRVPRELKGFSAVTVAAGAQQRVRIDIRRDDLCYWDIRAHRFVVEGGSYLIGVGASSRDIRLTATVAVPGDEVRAPLTLESTVAEVMADPAGSAALSSIVEGMFGGPDSGDALGMDMAKVVGSVPLSRIVTFSGGQLTADMLKAALDSANSTE
ncbi:MULTISPECIES: glycoside hydrolase family 3 C-terminal domain-containing protein [unclassified Gordonia (in: high G+C Gram-positive bacteria)]